MDYLAWVSVRVEVWNRNLVEDKWRLRESGDRVRVERVRESGDWERVETEWEWKGWVRVEVCESGLLFVTYEFWISPFYRDSISRWLPHGSSTSFWENTNRGSKCWDITRVLETRFPGGHHVEKCQIRTWSEQGNRVFETRFISPKSSFLNSRC